MIVICRSQASFCVTPGCKCGLRKLEDVRSGRALPGQEAAAEQAGEAELAEVPEALEPALEDLDPFRVEQSKQALHSLSGYRCRCPVCVKAKQRRDHAERDSHSEAKCQTTPGLHQFLDFPTYVDTIDFGGNQFSCGGARYDLFPLTALA